MNPKYINELDNISIQCNHVTLKIKHENPIVEYSKQKAHLSLFLYNVFM